MRALLLAPALVLGSALAAAPPARSGPAVARLEVPCAVLAGRTVTLRWPALPSRLEEAELVLSLDGGRTFPVRVSPELEPRERHFRWRVPDLPTSGAVLVLRVGGRGEGERVGARSVAFRIVHVAGSPAPDLAFHEGDLWTGPARLQGPGTGGFTARAPGLARAGAPAAPCVETEDAAAAAEAPAVARAPAPRGPVPAPAAPFRRAFPRTEVPLRI